MEVKDNAPLWYRDVKKRISNGRMWLWNRVVAAYNGDNRIYFITTEELWDFFKGYTNSEQGFTQFLNGTFCYRAPNSGTTKFLYDPFSGEKIDWDAIRRYYSEYIEKET